MKLHSSSLRRQIMRHAYHSKKLPIIILFYNKKTHLHHLPNLHCILCAHKYINPTTLHFTIVLTIHHKFHLPGIVSTYKNTNNLTQPSIQLLAHRKLPRQLFHPLSEQSSLESKNTVDHIVPILPLRLFRYILTLYKAAQRLNRARTQFWPRPTPH